MVNRHFDTANVSEHNFNHNLGDFRLTQATLAVAFEQRTANLIAYADLLRDQSDYTGAKTVQKEIKKRLDLPE